ncbi:MAG: type II toxin-antitoxin system RelE/ParE family toxin [Rhizomicrobium sp.]
MKLRFTPRAAQDVIEIADYIRAENPSAAERVRSTILESLQLLTDFPEIGRRQNVEGVRKHVARKYGYLVYYLIDTSADEIAVLTIQHPAREQPFAD